MLTTEQVNQIALEVINDLEPTITGPAADEIRESIRREFEEAKVQGITLEIPGEWPDWSEGL